MTRSETSAASLDKGLRVDFSPPDIREEEIEAVTEVLRSGWITTGPVSRQFEADLGEYCGVEHVVCLNSCTAALELTLRLLEIGPGDEVIVPAYTYTASAAVILHVGATPVMVDISTENYLPSIEQVLAAVTPRTRAIIVVDVAGIPYPAAELIEALDATHPGVSTGPSALPLGRPAVIADAAHSLGATRGGKRTGSLADFTAFSFHAVKNLTTAEGGALCWRDTLPADGAELERAVRMLALHGQTKDALAKSRAGAWEYDIETPGYKVNMPDVLAALGKSQLGRYEEILTHRRAVLDRYAAELGDLVSLNRPTEDGVTSSAHLAMVDLGEYALRRESIIEYLASQQIATNVHYKPLPLLTAYSRLGYDTDDYPNALLRYARELTLPLHSLLTDAQVDHVIASLRAALNGARATQENSSN